MKKLLALLTALTLGCVGLSSCGANPENSSTEENTVGTDDTDSSKESDKSEKSEKITKGDDGNAMPAADKVYKPKSDHVFLDLLEDIQKNQEITIVQSIIGLELNEAVTYAYSEPQGKYLYFTGINYGTYKDYNMGTLKHSSANILLERDGDEFAGTVVDTEAKVKTGTPVNHWDSDTGEQTIFENVGYDIEYIPTIPHNLTPDRWSFSESGTKTINGVEYYSETYDVQVGLEEYGSYTGEIVEERPMTVSVMFDSNGDMAFMGAELYTPKEGDSLYVRERYDADFNVIDSTDTAMSMLFFNDKDKGGYSLDTFSIFCYPVYEWYVPISIRSGFDKSWDLDSYTYVESFDEFTKSRNQEKEAAIREELGL